MAHVIAKRPRVSRRRFLKGITLAGGAIQRRAVPPLGEHVPIPRHGLCRGLGGGLRNTYREPLRILVQRQRDSGAGLDSRGDGADFHFSPCLTPLAPFRNDIHVLSGLDNQAANVSGPGNGHHKAISGVTTCTPFTGHGAGGPPAARPSRPRIGQQSRFSSIQIGVSQESFGESIQRNMSWAGFDRPLPPQMLPNKLFDYLFGVREEGWVKRKRSILDAVREDAQALEKEVPKDDAARVEEHLSAIRDLERGIRAGARGVPAARPAGL